MGSCRRVRAFTLIESMIVVAIVGILAVLASVAYRRWIQSSYAAEAHDMISNIRSAEESFRSENGTYLPVSTQLDLGFLYPATNPGSFKTAWGGPCGTCINSWDALSVAPQGPVIFGYAVVANNQGTVPGVEVGAATQNMQAAPDLSGLTGQPWYVVEAAADVDGNGTYTRMLGVSATPQLFVDREGE